MLDSKEGALGCKEKGLRGTAGKSKREQNRRVLHQSRAKGGNDLSWEGKPESRNGTCGLIIKAGGEGDGEKIG